MTNALSPADKIFVAGHRGLVGSALVRQLNAAGFDRVITRSHADLDLEDQRAVDAFFAAEHPAFVFLAAARVGGILANSAYPGDFIYQNIAIQNNVINAAKNSGVKRLLFLGSSCIYPRLAPQPIKEESLLTGPLEITNQAYAIAKISGIEMCRAYNIQYGTKYLAVMPTNLYGPGDNYDLQKSHVLPALIRKMHEANVTGSDKVVVWGSGAPKREFLYSDDLARACLHLMQLGDTEYQSVLGGGNDIPLINVGVGEDLTIRELAELVRDVVGFSGAIAWDSSKPDGTPRKLLDVSRVHALGWRASIDLRTGIGLAYNEFLRTIATA